MIFFLSRCMLRGFRLHRCPYWVRPSITVSDHNGMLLVFFALTLITCELYFWPGRWLLSVVLGDICEPFFFFFRGSVLDEEASQDKGPDSMPLSLFFISIFGLFFIQYWPAYFMCSPPLWQLEANEFDSIIITGVVDIWTLLLYPEWKLWSGLTFPGMENQESFVNMRIRRNFFLEISNLVQEQNISQWWSVVIHPSDWPSIFI